MLDKITKSSNVGSTGSLLMDAGCENFARHNIIYGSNGSGKTTFSSVCWLFSDNLEVEQRASIQSKLAKDDKLTIDLELDFAGKKSKLGKSLHPIYVFNPEFVAGHVYDGKTTNIKKFKEGIVTAGQLKNPKINLLEDDASKLRIQEGLIETEQTRLVKTSSKLKQTISTELNQKTVGLRMPAINLPGALTHELPPASLADLKKELAKHYANYEKSRSNTDLETNRQSISATYKSDYPDITVNITNLISTELKTTASEHVKERIKNAGTFDLKHYSAQQWYEDGKTILEHGKESHTCPLCSSNLDNIDTIIEEYQNFFNDEQAELDKKLASASVYIETLETELNNLKAQLSKLEIIKATYQDVIGNIDLVEYAPEIKLHLSILSKLKRLLDSKKKNISYELSDKDKELIGKIKLSTGAVNKVAGKLESSRSTVYEKLLSVGFNQKNFSQTIINVFLRQFNDQADITSYFEVNKAKKPDEVEGGLSFYKYLGEKLSETQRSIRQKEIGLKSLLKSLKQESKLVNHYLKKLSIHTYEILIDDNSQGDIEIIYTSGSHKNSSDNSLSDGEKSSLAFAYFLSKIRHEVIDNTNPTIELEKTIVVIDDPASSLDEDRLFSTSLVLRDEFCDKAMQLFVLSHNLLFLKFLSSVFKQKDIDRKDYIISNSEISMLPSTMRNFHTSYFYKLSKIVQYSEDLLTHDKVKDYLPNYIRTVLETFLSFKFCRLKGDSNQYESAGLAQLIKAINGYAGSLKNHQKVNGIDQNNLIEELEKINRKVDPESHGTPQDITDFEHISENELQTMAKKTLWIIQFIDAIHMQEIKNRL